MVLCNHHLYYVFSPLLLKETIIQSTCHLSSLQALIYFLCAYTVDLFPVTGNIMYFIYIVYFISYNIRSLGSCGDDYNCFSLPPSLLCCWALNPGSCVRLTSALPLSCTSHPYLSFSFYFETGSSILDLKILLPAEITGMCYHTHPQLSSTLHYIL